MKNPGYWVSRGSSQTGRKPSLTEKGSSQPEGGLSQIRRGPFHTDSTLLWADDGHMQKTESLVRSAKRPSCRHRAFLEQWRANISQNFSYQRRCSQTGWRCYSANRGSLSRVERHQRNISFRENGGVGFLPLGVEDHENILFNLLSQNFRYRIRTWNREIG